jgi:integrase
MTQRRRLTDITIKGLRAGTAYREVVDTSGLRLALQPSPSDTKTWVTRYRRPGSKKPAKLVHGRYPALSLSAARVAHARALDAVAAGADPGEAKRRKKVADRQAETDRAADTVAKHAQAFLDWQAKRLRPEGWRQQQHVLRDYVMPVWGSKSVHDVCKRDVIDLVEGIAETKPIMANRTLTIIKNFYRWLHERRDVVTFSPANGVPKPSEEQSRDRMLGNDEIGSLWRALDSVGGPAADAVRVVLLTGQRRGEVGGMRWDELRGDVWSLPKERTKNGRPHSITLSRQALEVIERQPRIDGSHFVFGLRPIGSFSHVKRMIDAAMPPEIPRWCIHDLRRSAASGMQRLGIRAEVIELTLNHRSGHLRGVAGIYQRDPLVEEVRAGLARWADFVERIVAGESGKVVTLRR